MALDEPKEGDIVKEEEGFRVVVDKGLAESSGGLVMDYLTGPFRKGFQVKANKASAFGC